MMMIGILSGLGAWLLYALKNSFFRVGEGHVAALSRFGAALRDGQERVRLYEPGLHGKLPWDRVHLVPLMEQIVDLTQDDDVRTAMAEDGTVLRFDPVLRYSVAREQIERYLFDLEDPDAHVRNLFTCLLRNEIANFRAPAGQSLQDAAGGSYALIRRKRKKLSDDIAVFCAQEMEGRYNVVFHAVDLADIIAPDELAEALNAVMSAHATAQAEFARAEADAEQRVLASRKGVEIARERATAAEREIDTLAGFLGGLDEQGTLDLYVARRKAEVVSQVKTLYLRSS